MTLVAGIIYPNQHSHLRIKRNLFGEVSWLGFFLKGTDMEELISYVENNMLKVLMIGGIGLGSAFLIGFLLRGSNGRWRWQK
jgi:hypothetical protein